MVEPSPSLVGDMQDDGQNADQNGDGRSQSRKSLRAFAEPDIAKSFVAQMLARSC